MTKNRINIVGNEIQEVGENENGEKIYCELNGAVKVLRVYDDRVSLESIKNFRSFLTHNLLGGTKDIFYRDMVGVQYKPASKFLLGYVQFETSSSRSGDNFNNENSWTFNTMKETVNENIEKLVLFLRKKINESKNPTVVSVAPAVSTADELIKWKGLLDQGIISQEDFDRKKHELLNK